MLAIAYKGTAIPVYWILLDKRGNSNTRERIALMKRFIKQFGKDTYVACWPTGSLLGKVAEMAG